MAMDMAPRSPVIVISRRTPFLRRVNRSAVRSSRQPRSAVVLRGCPDSGAQMGPNRAIQHDSHHNKQHDNKQHDNRSDPASDGPGEGISAVPAHSGGTSLRRGSWRCDPSVVPTGTVGNASAPSAQLRPESLQCVAAGLLAEVFLGRLGSAGFREWPPRASRARVQHRARVGHGAGLLLEGPANVRRLRASQPQRTTQPRATMPKSLTSLVSQVKWAGVAPLGGCAPLHQPTKVGAISQTRPRDLVGGRQSR